MEHINDVDCVLKKFSQILNPGGTLIVGYPIEYKVTKVIRLLESAFRNDLSSKIVQNSYKKTEEFAGHISGWKKIDLALSNNFHVDKKVDLKFCFMKYYALRKAYKKQ